MLRCRECEHFDKLEIQSKKFYYCDIKQTNGLDMKLWDKVPKAHPRWCPLWKGERNVKHRK